MDLRDFLVRIERGLRTVLMPRAMADFGTISVEMAFSHRS